MTGGGQHLGGRTTHRATSVVTCAAACARAETLYIHYHVTGPSLCERRSARTAQRG